MGASVSVFMGKMKKEISKYIDECLMKGYSFAKIEAAWINGCQPHRFQRAILPFHGETAIEPQHPGKRERHPKDA